MFRSRVALFLVLGAWSLVGFGCREPRLTPPAPIIAETPRLPSVPYKRRETIEEGPSKEFMTLQQVFTNLQKAKSYRLRLQTAGAQGAGELFFSRTKGIHVQLTAQGVSSELFLAPNSTMVRYGTSSWESIATEEADAIREQMFALFSFDTSGESRFLVRESAIIKEGKSDPSGCKPYSVEQKFYRPETITQRMEICVQGSYPVRIKTLGEGGLELLYDRFDDETILATSPVK